MSNFEKKPYRILAVDDELTILGLYEQILSPHYVRNEVESKPSNQKRKPFLTAPNFEVTCCNQGDQAVEAVKLSLKEGHPFALAFVDLNMPPGPDGNWTAAQIHKLDPGINIILVTGYASTDTDEIKFESDFTDKLLLI